MGKIHALIAIVLAVILVPAIGLGFPKEVMLEDTPPDDSLEGQFFYFLDRAALRPINGSSAWVMQGETDTIIGYATWDALYRKWTLFTLKSNYAGFLQATFGTMVPPHYQQYLWYDKENRYKGLFVARLGGRPVTPDLPFGELGGERDYYARGSIPAKQAETEVEVDPLKRFPTGVDISPIERPVRSFK